MSRKNELLSGWERESKNDRAHRYYPVPTTWEGHYTILLRMHTREVKLYAEPESGNGTLLLIPDTIQTLEEAQAWAVATWRML